MAGIDHELAETLIEGLMDREGLTGEARDARRAELWATQWVNDAMPYMAELVATGSIVLPHGRVDVDPVTGQRSWHPYEDSQ